MYWKKKDNNEMFILARVKDLSTLVPGNSYHLRKFIKQEGNIVTDEVHDIILKEVVDEFLVEQDTDTKFSSKEFEVFYRRK